MQVLHGFEFKVEPLGDHTFEVEPQENVDQGAGLQEVQTQELMDYQLACDRAGLKDDMDARSDVYVLSNGCRKCSDDNNGYYWEYTPGKLVQTLLKGHSMLSLEDSLSGVCDVEKNGRYREYDLAHLKLVLEFSIYNGWKSVQYGVSNGLDTAYWGFLGAQIRRIFLMDTAYWSSE
ncbi:hypothetical protein Tco_1381844 [Tanacetum coccineum]